MKKSNRASYRCESWKYIDKFYAKGIPAIAFSEIWLDFMLDAHLSITDNLKRKSDKIELGKLDGQYEDKYLEIISRYKSDRPMGERPADYFANAADGPDIRTQHAVISYKTFATVAGKP
jgi:hypothetical protein